MVNLIDVINKIRAVVQCGRVSAAQVITKSTLIW